MQERYCLSQEEGGSSLIGFLSERKPEEIPIKTLNELSKFFIYTYQKRVRVDEIEIPH